MIHPCDKPCDNKTASGYCATTVCINPQYSNIGTVQYGQGVQKRIVTHGDELRAMTDEELAEYLAPCACPPIRFNKNTGDIVCPVNKEPSESDCKSCWLDWLRLECIKWKQ